MSFFLVALLASLPVWNLDVRVVDAEGQPVEAVRVEPRDLVRPNELASDREGRFTISTLPRGRATVTLTKEGWLERTKTFYQPLFYPDALAFHLSHPLEDEPGVVVLKREARILGTLRTADGRPAADAKVELRYPYLDEALVSVRSKADGSFEIGDLHRWRYVVRARDAEHGWTEVEASVPSAGALVDLGTIFLEPATLFEGWVTEDSSEPVGEAAIYVSTAERFGLHEKILEVPSRDPAARTDSEGYFALDSLPEGSSFRLEVHAEGFVARRLEARTDAEPVEIVLEKEARIEGRVISAGVGLEGARLGLFRIDKAPTFSSWGDQRSDEDGGFGFERLSEGTWEVLVWASGFASRRSSRIALDTGESREIEIVLEPEAVLFGRILTAFGEPVGEAGVRLHDPEASAGSEQAREDAPVGNSATTDPQGRFEIRGLSSGAWAIEVYHVERETMRGSLTLGPEERREIELRFPALDLQTVTIRVVGPDHSPLAGASCSLATEEGEPLRHVSGGARGACVFDSLPDGRFLLDLHRDGYVQRMPHVVLVVDGPLSADLVMVPAED